jgi:MFS family permease
MRAEVSKHAAIGTLIVATSIVQLANGFFGTFFSLRVAVEGFEATVAGLVLSSYFAGFMLGAVRSDRIIARIGHIRAYAAFGGLVGAATAVMPLLVAPYAWMALRAVVGFGCAGLFVATESWLNAKAPPAMRGRVFAVYMVGTFVALAAGQLLIGHIDIAAAAPFNAIVALFAVALVMVSFTRAEPPQAAPAIKMPFRELAHAAPIAVAGSALSGVITGTFYALVPAWMQGAGVVQQTIGLFMFAAVAGGLAFQVPVGRLSDRLDRRRVVAGLGLGLAAVVLALVFLPRSLPMVLPAAPTRRLHVDALSGLRGSCQRPHAGGPGGRGERRAHPAERGRIGDRSADRHPADGPLRHQRRALPDGRRRAAPGDSGRGAEFAAGSAGP